MLGTRYEEYAHRNERLPFVLKTDIERNPFNCSPEANWHDNPELQWCKKGKGVVLMDGVQYAFEPDDFAAVNTHVIHYTGTDDALVYSCLILDPEFCEQAGFDCSALFFEPHFRSPVLRSLFCALERICADRDDVCRIAKAERTVLDILIELRQHHTLKIRTPSEESPMSERIRRAIVYIRENYNRKLCLAEIARAVYVDVYTLSREFKAVTRMTVVQYINNYRCKCAAEYLACGASVSEAAERCGFHNLSYFSKTFQSCFHVLPSRMYKTDTSREKRQRSDS